jgi:cytochrome P450
MVDDLLDGLDGETDFIDAFAFPLPANVIGELLGIPAPDRAQFQTLIPELTQVLEQTTPELLSKADRAAATIFDYFTKLIERRRRESRK